MLGNISIQINSPLSFQALRSPAKILSNLNKHTHCELPCPRYVLVLSSGHSVQQIPRACLTYAQEMQPSSNRVRHQQAEHTCVCQTGTEESVLAVPRQPSKKCMSSVTVTVKVPDL